VRKISALAWIGVSCRILALLMLVMEYQTGMSAVSYGDRRLPPPRDVAVRGEGCPFLHVGGTERPIEIRLGEVDEGVAERVEAGVGEEVGDGRLKLGVGRDRH
jgi:hypothetical protein